MTPQTMNTSFLFHAFTIVLIRGRSLDGALKMYKKKQYAGYIYLREKKERRIRERTSCTVDFRFLYLCFISQSSCFAMGLAIAGL